MPRRTRSQKPTARSSPVGNAAEHSNSSDGSPSDAGSHRADSGEPDYAAASSSKEQQERRREFQPPPTSRVMTPSSSKREMAPSSSSRRLPMDHPSRGQTPHFFSPPSSQRHSISMSAMRQGGSGSHSKPPSSGSRRWQPPPQARASPPYGAGPHDSSHYMPPTSEQRRAARMSDPGSCGPPPRPSPEMKEGLGSIAEELDLAAKGHDDFGPTVADCLNLGSFEAESPPQSEGGKNKQQHDPERRRASLKSSPPPMPGGYPPFLGGLPYSSYRPSPPPPMYSGGPPPMYYPPVASHPQASPTHPYGGYPGSAGGGYPYFSSYGGYSSGMLPPPSGPRGEQWSSPQAFPEEGPYGGPPPQSRPQDKDERRSDQQTPSSRKRGWERSDSSSPPDNASTPQKAPKTKSEEGQTPCRSPEKSMTESAKKFKRSPLFASGTPNSGYYGSFGMDTPGGTIDAAKLDAFSPMGPSFPAGFGDETTPFPSIPIAGVGGSESELPFEVTHSPDGRSRPMIQQRVRGDPNAASPFSRFMGELSPLQGGIRLHGSPMLTKEQSEYGLGGEPTIPSLAAASKRPTGGRHVLTSPLAPVSGSMPKQKKSSWYDPTGSVPGPVRLELGDVGMKSAVTRKTLEGINTMVRGASAPPPRHGRGYDSRGPGSAVRRDIGTPMKIADDTPLSGGRSSGEPTTAGKPQGFQAPTPAAGSRNLSTGKSGGRASAPTPAKNGAAGKENATPKKRSPCNCKKSRCLKLYCECFANERFCDGCNCADCKNTPANEVLRSKAMKDTRAKNPNAFKPRIAVRPGAGPSGNSPPSGHNMGCRCKRSECLKKYCECFQAGVMCGSKCKCVECLNYVGSQALIDKRRKIKDHKGAEFAMRSADDAWKGKHVARGGNQGVPPHGLSALPSPASGRGPHGVGAHPNYMPPMIQPSPGHHGGPRGPPPPPYGMPPLMMGPPMGYSPMGMPPVTPYGSSKPMVVQGEVRRSGRPSATRGRYEPGTQHAPMLVTPRTPAVRLGFDPHSSKKKRKLSPGSKEPTFPYFGPKCPEHPKTTALGVFSFLSNDELYNAGLVCKRWTSLAFDEELWQF